MAPPAPGVTVMVLALSLTERPFRICVLAAAFPVSSSVPPLRIRFETGLIFAMLFVEKSSFKVPAFTSVLPE